MLTECKKFFITTDKEGKIKTSGEFLIFFCFKMCQKLIKHGTKAKFMIVFVLYTILIVCY